MVLLGSRGGRRQASEGRSPRKRGKRGGGGGNVLTKWESPWQTTLLPSPRPSPPRRSPTEGCLQGRHEHPAQHLCGSRAVRAPGSQAGGPSGLIFFGFLQWGRSRPHLLLSPFLGPGMRAEGKAEGNTRWQVSIASAGGGWGQHLQLAPSPLAKCRPVPTVSIGLELPGGVWSNPAPSLLPPFLPGC